MRPGVGVDALLGHRRRQRAGLAGDHRRLGEEGRRGGGLGELRGELTEAQVLALLPDQAEGGDVPERGGAAVAEHHLVAVGQREQLGGGPSRTRPTVSRTGACRWEVPISEVPVAASASRAPAGIFEGPAPNRPSAGLMSSGSTMWVTVPILSAMVDIPGWRVERVPITHPDAALLVEEVQEEYVRRYGGRDETPIEPTYFDEPMGVVLRRLPRRRPGGHGRLAPAYRRAGRRHQPDRRDQADVRRPRAPSAADWPGRCWPTSRTPPGPPGPR